MIVCIFEHVQWRWALHDRLARGYSRRASERCIDRRRSPSRRRGLCIDEGTLSLVKMICAINTDSLYNREWGGMMTEYPRLEYPAASWRCA